MQSLIDNSTAYYGSGNTEARRQFKLRAGPYNGRKLVVYQADASVIKCRYADAPYTNWSEPLTITENSADFPCSGCLDADGNVYVVYTVQSSLYLAMRKLSFASGVWTVGSESVIYNDKANYYGSVIKDSTGRLHVCWVCIDSATGVQTTRHKRSTSDGALWGSGPEDSGTVLGESSSASFCVAVYAEPYVYCFHTENSAQVVARRLLDGASIWEDPAVIYSGIYLNDRLGAGVSESGSLIGVVFEANFKLWYAECDATGWGGAFAIADFSATAPLLLYNGEIPFVFYGIEIGSNQVELRYRHRSGVGFAPEQLLASEFSRFAAVYLYDNDGSPKFHNRTLESASTTIADVIATDSHALISAVDDALYVGSDEPFARISIALSTVGSGGAVVWEYYSDSGWKSFTPESGAFHFDQLTQRLRLWQDTASAPTDWQKCAIESRSHFWLRARVTTAFTTAPVGSQITPCTSITFLNN